VSDRAAPFPPGTIDAHVHVGLAKYGPIEPYLAAMDRLGLRGAVLVQYRWERDNTYLLECAARFPDRFRAVGVVDHTSDDARDQARAWAGLGLAGFRIPADAATRPIFEVAAELGLVLSVHDQPEAIVEPAFVRLLRDFPEVSVRLEHLGGIRHDAVGPSHPVGRAFLALATCPSVWTMWSGFWLNAGEPFPYPRARELAAASLDAFGADRICWSGDWNREGVDDRTYRREADLVGQAFGVRDERERAAILGRTAEARFRILGTARSR
jgi:predicted TIM-barrel fold metal-dependent hydrolase